MKKNLLKQAILALLLTAAVPTLTAQVHVGDILCEGNLIYPPSTYPVSGATAIGVVFYVDNTGQHGWAVALEDAGSFAWGCFGTDMPLPNYGDKRQAIHDLDGYENTRIVRENCMDTLAFYSIDFANGWYVPAIGQLNYLYGNLVEVNYSLKIVNGNELENSESWHYWSSTENANYYSWYIASSGEINVGNRYLVHNGAYETYYVYNDAKNSSKRVRAVRNF